MVSTQTILLVSYFLTALSGSPVIEGTRNNLEKNHENILPKQKSVKKEELEIHENQAKELYRKEQDDENEKEMKNETKKDISYPDRDNLLQEVFTTTDKTDIPDADDEELTDDEIDRYDSDVYDFYSWEQLTDIFPETVFPEGWTEGVVKFFTEPSSPFNYALSYDYSSLVDSVKHLIEFIVSDKSPGAYIVNYDYSTLFSRVQNFISSGDYRGILDESVEYFEDTLGAHVARGFGLVFFIIISAVLVIVFLPLLALVGSFAAAISVALLLGSDILAAKLIEEFGVVDLGGQSSIYRGFKTVAETYFSGISFPVFDFPNIIEYLK
ncbi:uncharacterized protein LOC111707132 isoform X2 [Eurytemora carolleeae]|uniref:uncharacterized protein LOC111707132 isoform X2 n=1 Tax=Eurytemora carolleeae TaxID=1294199 RepID=UPI000C785E5E|nr:uncharacterized protein LOC111707132 isoform X2 [Eurytemora carolleeae]|eukprot:XP_023335909.1 uncharacterized protein LOC111707132 isoform X2 [Eurytemora affinis]